MRQAKAGADNRKKQPDLWKCLYRKCIQQSPTEVGRIAAIPPTGQHNKENRIQCWNRHLGLTPHRDLPLTFRLYPLE